MPQDFSHKQQSESKNIEQAPPANGAGMEDAIYVRGKARAEIAGLPGVFRGVERHVNHHGRADDVFARNATPEAGVERVLDRKSTRLNSSHLVISYAVFCLKKK